MPFIEIFARSGTVRDEQRAVISSRVTAEAISAVGLPDTEPVRARSWTLWRDVEHWFVGGESVAADEPPRYVVRVTVAQGVLTPERQNDIVDRVVKALAETDDDPGRFEREPTAWVQFVEIPPDRQCMSQA